VIGRSGKSSRKVLGDIPARSHGNVMTILPMLPVFQNVRRFGEGYEQRHPSAGVHVLMSRISNRRLLFFGYGKPMLMPVLLAQDHTLSPGSGRRF
jgi:hypothetical protein